MESKIKRVRFKTVYKSFTLLAFIFTPIFMYSDGGTFSRSCTSYKDYDSQPTKMANLRMVAIGLKINGKDISIHSKRSFITPFGYHTDLLSIDTLFFHNMIVNEANTEITGIDCWGSVNK